MVNDNTMARVTPGHCFIHKRTKYEIIDVKDGQVTFKRLDSKVLFHESIEVLANTKRITWEDSDGLDNCPT